MQALSVGAACEYVVMDWQPELGTQITLVPLNGDLSGIRRFTMPAYFTFHYVNAFESGAYRKAEGIVTKHFISSLKAWNIRDCYGLGLMNVAFEYVPWTPGTINNPGPTRTFEANACSAHCCKMRNSRKLCSGMTIKRGRIDN